MSKKTIYEEGLKNLNKSFNPKGIKFESVDDYFARIKKDKQRKEATDE